MLLSLRHNYLFIANQKVASEAIHLVAGDDADLGLARVGTNKHATLPELMQLLEASGLELSLDGLFIFSIVREPAEWYISWYNSRARPGLANPSHRRHKMYTGNITFDEFLESARGPDPDPMTNVKHQNLFVRAPKGLTVVPLPFDELGELFSWLFPVDSSIARFTPFKREHHKNRSKVVRFTAKDLTQDQREFVNNELFPRDYKLFLKAKRKAGKCDPVEPGSTDVAAQLRSRLGSTPQFATLASETAFSIATARIYAGDSVEQVRAQLTDFANVDIDALLEEVAPRANRFLSE